MDKKVQLIGQLIQLALADNDLKDIELNFIKAIAEMLSVSSEEVDKLYESGSYNSISIPSSEFERILQFHRLILVANVDLVVDQSEIELLKKTGLRLGLRPEAVDRVLVEMTKHPNGMIPTDIMMRLFQAYHN
jgi:hypothetical protein